jgi:hypothetical protein
MGNESRAGTRDEPPPWDKLPPSCVRGHFQGYGNFLELGLNPDHEDLHLRLRVGLLHCPVEPMRANITARAGLKQLQTLILKTAPELAVDSAVIDSS